MNMTPLNFGEPRYTEVGYLTNIATKADQLFRMLSRKFVNHVIPWSLHGHVSTPFLCDWTFNGAAVRKGSKYP
jgi:hypothetical protein